MATTKTKINLELDITEVNVLAVIIPLFMKLCKRNNVPVPISFLDACTQLLMKILMELELESTDEPH